MRAVVVLGALLIVAGCATPSQSAGPTTEPTVGVSAPPSVNAGSGEPELVGITVDGMARQFRLVQPTGVDGQVPLLIALHQYGGTR